MADKMTYRVALDDKKSEPTGAMAATWMKAAGQDGIPTAFVVNPQGKIAWIGHPNALNDAVIESILSGKQDLAKAAADYKQMMEELERMRASSQSATPSSAAPADVAACKANLAKIGTAIAAYRKDHKDIPNGLSDLVPKYLSDTNALVCPVCAQTGAKSPIGVLDSKVFSSYLFEFAPVPMPQTIKEAFPGTDLTMRAWKRQQMEIAGEKVPIVRCFLHLPTALNLSYGGEVYESEQLWETLFYDKVKPEAFNPH
jgi:hypothetical protein